VVTWPL